MLFKTCLFNTREKKKKYNNNTEIQKYINNNLKIIVLKWNDETELPDGSRSVQIIQDYDKYIIKSMKYYWLIIIFMFTSTAIIIN